MVPLLTLNSTTSRDQAGEALTVTDSNEAWVFHILSDDTTTSAVWAAQRVPDDHVTVVANQFIINEVKAYVGFIGFHRFAVFKNVSRPYRY